MIPILCDNTKTLTELVNDNSNGIGRLSGKAVVRQAANGAYVATMVYPVNGDHFSDIAVGGHVKLKPNERDDIQIFKIAKISRPMNGQVTINLNHISYDLSKTSVAPFSATGAANILAGIKDNMVSGSSYPWEFWTDISNTTSEFLLTKPQSARACLGGVDGSFLDIFKTAQFEWDNLTVKAHAQRGEDNGVRIAYGKNITDIKMDENIESMYTAVQPYVIVDENAVMGDLQTIVSVNYPKILNLDLSSYFDSGTTITTAMINSKAQEYIADNDLATPNISIDVSFLPLWQTEEYKDIAPLEEVGLFDEVTVSFSPLGIEAKAEVTEYEYDVINERYNYVHLGSLKSTLGKTITQMVKTGTDKADQSAVITSMTDVILNAMGLFKTKVLKPNGGYQFYLHNKPLLASSQYQWTINSGGFALSQDYGQTWSAGIDASGNAVFNALSANIIRAMEIYGSYIEGATIKFNSGDYSVTASPTVWTDDEEVVYGGVRFKGAGDIGMEGRSIGMKSVDASRGIQMQANGYIRMFCGDKVIVELSKTNGLSIWVDGVGYSGLKFVDDGNGHAVLGKE